MQKVKIEVLDVPDRRKLLPIYNLYKKIFVLKDGRENLDGFEYDLKLNLKERLLDNYGPFKELWISLVLNGKIIGAINFSVYIMPANIVKKYNVQVTSQVIYILVDPEYRKQGIGKRLIMLAENYSKKFAKSNLNIKTGKINLLNFCDFYSPELMTLKEYLNDTVGSKMDPCDRAVFWCNQGFKQINFSYVIPPLNKRTKSCHLLILNVKSSKSQISNEVVFEHLKRFFEISVLKEKNLENYSYTREKHDLRASRNLNLLNKKKTFINLKEKINRVSLSAQKRDYNRKIIELLLECD
jgi:GNAT superfamily N-acetyltransferase